MNKINRDYLWLCERPPRRSSRLRVVALLLGLPLVAGAAWLGLGYPNELFQPRVPTETTPSSASVAPAAPAARANESSGQRAPVLALAPRADVHKPGNRGAEDASSADSPRARPIRIAPIGAADIPADADDALSRRLDEAPAAGLTDKAAWNRRNSTTRPGDTLSITLPRAGLSYLLTARRLGLKKIAAKSSSAGIAAAIRQHG